MQKAPTIFHYNLLKVLCARKFLYKCKQWMFVREFIQLECHFISPVDRFLTWWFSERRLHVREQWARPSIRAHTQHTWAQPNLIYYLMGNSFWRFAQYTDFSSFSKTIHNVFALTFVRILQLLQLLCYCHFFHFCHLLLLLLFRVCVRFFGVSSLQVTMFYCVHVSHNTASSTQNVMLTCSRWLVGRKVYVKWP